MPTSNQYPYSTTIFCIIVEMIISTMFHTLYNMYTTRSLTTQWEQAESNQKDHSIPPDELMKKYSSSAQRLFNLANSDEFIIPSQLKWEELKQSLYLSYSTNQLHIGRNILKNVTPIDRYGLKHSYELIIRASKFYDVYAASRIIGNIGKHNEYSAREASQFWNKKSYDTQVMVGLPENWKWAYASAILPNEHMDYDHGKFGKVYPLFSFRLWHLNPLISEDCNAGSLPDEDTA